MATSFAERGKERLTREALQRDLAALLTGDAPMPRWSREVLARFRDLPLADAAALVKALPKEQGVVLSAGYAALQLHRHEPVQKSVEDLSGAMYPLIEPSIRARLELYAPSVRALPEAEIAPPGK